MNIVRGLAAGVKRKLAERQHEWRTLQALFVTHTNHRISDEPEHLCLICSEIASCFAANVPEERGFVKQMADLALQLLRRLRGTGSWAEEVKICVSRSYLAAWDRANGHGLFTPTFQTVHGYRNGFCEK